MRILIAVLLVFSSLAVGGAYVLYQEAGRLDEALAQSREQMLETQRTLVDQQELAAELERERQQGEANAARILELETELSAALTRREDVDRLIEKAAEDLRAERERHNQEILAAKKFMPEGLRLALIAANECLGLDGFPSMRFLSAEKIEDQVLYGVKFLDRDPTYLSNRLYRAERMTFDLDRLRGQLTLNFHDGHLVSAAGRRDFPADGERLVLPDVDGRRWESRLPYLVNGFGVYPAFEAKTREPGMELSLKQSWQSRMNALLANADTEFRYRIGTFHSLVKGEFTDCLVLGYDKSKRLAMSAECQRLCIRVDATSESVELLLNEGVLRRTGGEGKIPDGGHRIRLPGVTPAQAREAMLGMVKRQ